MQKRSGEALHRRVNTALCGASVNNDSPQGGHWEDAMMAMTTGLDFVTRRGAWRRGISVLACAGALLGGLVVLVAGRFVSHSMALRCVWFVDAAIHFLLFLVGRRLLTTERLEAARSAGIAGAPMVVDVR